MTHSSSYGAGTAIRILPHEKQWSPGSKTPLGLGLSEAKCAKKSPVPPDLKCIFPASAARKLDFGDVPLICAQELDIDGALSHVVRVMVHVETQLPKSAIKHVYLRGAEVLRQDIAQ